MRRKGPSPVPEEAIDVFKLKAIGVTFSYAEYLTLPCKLRDDLILWAQAESMASKDA